MTIRINRRTDITNITNNSNSKMVESFGTENYKFNKIDESEFSMGNPGDMQGHYSGKERRGGVGGKNSKSNNFKEQKNAKKRANEKRQREEEKVEAQ